MYSKARESQPRLRLRREEPVEPRSGEPAEERTLRFPIEALRSLPGRGWGRGNDDRREAVRSDDLARQIERTLDHVQNRIDDVKDQLDSAFRLIFPSPSDPPRPSAA